MFNRKIELDGVLSKGAKNTWKVHVHWKLKENTIVSAPDHCLFVYFSQSTKASLMDVLYTLHRLLLEHFIWTASSEFGTYQLCEQRRFRRACASAQSRQNLRCSLIQAVSQEEPSDRKSDPWPLWMARHAQLKFVMTECSKTQIRLTGLILKNNYICLWRIVSSLQQKQYNIFLKTNNLHLL